MLSLMTLGKETGKSNIAFAVHLENGEVWKHFQMQNNNRDTLKT